MSLRFPMSVFSNSTIDPKDQKEEMKTSIRTIGIGLRRFALLRFLALSAFSCAALVVAGCGSSRSVKPVVGAISFTDANGKPLTQLPIVSLGVNQGLYMMTTLSDDNGLLGADWSVACASALAPGTPLPPGQTQDLSCGSFAPAHSISGPIPVVATTPNGYIVFYSAPAAVPKGGTVTLIASATADHSRASTVTLNILP